jgi:hypothetical protein
LAESGRSSDGQAFQLKRRRELHSNNASKHNAQLLQACGVLS